MTLKLAPRVDFDVYYAADSAQHEAAVLAVVTREVFTRFYENCPSIGFECDGVPFGGVIFDGDRPHVAVLPAWQGRWGPLLRPALRWLYGWSRDMVVPVYDDNLPLRRFIERCGWPEVGRQPGAAMHRMTPMGARRIAQIADVAPAQPAAVSPCRPSAASAARAQPQRQQASRGMFDRANARDLLQGPPA